MTVDKHDSSIVHEMQINCNEGRVGFLLLKIISLMTKEEEENWEEKESTRKTICKIKQLSAPDLKIICLT